jgi:glycosyltransferase involved in cell wall biosynthesis
VTDGAAPRTTVVIPVWDRYASLRMREAVASISSQDRLARLLVVDNASTVPLPELAEGSVVRSPERLTLGAARNLGLAEVGTPYVIFWDADDVMEPGTLGFLEDRLAEDPRLVAFGSAIIEEPSGIRHRWPRAWISRVMPYPRVFAAINCVWSMFPTTGATVMRTAAVRSCGGYSDADSGDDWCLGAALAFRGRFGWSERPGRHYLQHEGSIWDTYGTGRHQLAHAAAVRARLSQDDAIPLRLRASLPLFAVAQWAAVGAHLGAARIRAETRRYRVRAAP